MRGLVGMLVLLGVGVLIADALDWVAMDYFLLTLLPAAVGALIVLWRLVEDERKPEVAPLPLRVTLMRNVVSRCDRKPPVPVEIKKVFSKRWDSGKN